MKAKKTNRKIEGSFVVLETNSCGELDTHRIENSSIHWPFATQKLAKNWIRCDAEDTFTFSGDTKIGADSEWGSVMLICEVKKIIKPIIHVNVTAKLKEVRT